MAVRKEIVGRRRYAEFLKVASKLLLSIPLFRFALLLFVLVALLAVILLPCKLRLLLLGSGLTVATLGGMLLHEFVHYVMLDMDVAVVAGETIIRIDPQADAGRARLIASAVSGPMLPFLIGTMIAHVDYLNAIGLPLLAHILLLPLDIAGALGLRLEDHAVVG